MDQAEIDFLALLVYKGLLAEDAARRVIPQRQEGESVCELLARHGLLEREEAERLFRNRVGESPVFNRYELGQRIGEGATAIVFAANDRKSGDTVALKVLREEVARVPEKLTRFVEEAQMLCDLSHEGIVQGLRVAKDDGTYFLAMELVPGETIEESLHRGELCSEDEALHIVYQVGKTLCYLREQGVVHRDIKPGNLMRRPDGRVQLIDLGFAARIGEVRQSDTTLGTVHYIAPEQARGESDLDARADIYSLGATLYHLCTGELPFTGEDSREVMIRQVTDELSSKRIRDLEHSPTLHYFIEKMMAKDKAIRYQGPEDLVQDFEEKLSDRSFMKEPDTKAVMTPVARKRRRVRAGARGQRRPRRRGRR